MLINSPDAVDGLTSAFHAYERALLANDLDALSKFFLDSEDVVRFGTRSEECLYGHAQIVEFRLKRGAVDQRRELRNVRIVTYGNDFGVATTEYVPFGSAKIGRQSQTWVRSLQGDWQIVSAHVSFGA